jgi:hypothetical protein
MCEEKDEYQDLLPHWATGFAGGVWQKGAQLQTRDGRNTGNAVILSSEIERHGHKYWPVLTDAGTEINFTTRELEDLFWPPQWLMNPDTAPGVNNRKRKEA